MTRISVSRNDRIGIMKNPFYKSAVVMMLDKPPFVETKSAMIPLSEMRPVWLFALGMWVVSSLLSCLFYPVMMSDSVARYAPMAEAFARGDWEIAFHPRFGVLFQTLSGCLVAATGLDGARSLQIVGFGMLSLSIVPVWCIARRLFDRRIAYFAAALLFFGDDFFRYSLDGLRDGCKCLGFALLGLGIVERRGLWYGLGIFVLISLASYCFAVGTVFCFGWAVWALYRRLWKELLWPILGWLAASAAVTAMVYMFTGHILPAPHYIRFLGRWL